MKKLIILTVLAIIPYFSFCQTKIAGKFSTASETIPVNQHVAQQGGGTSRTINKSYLIVQGKVYDLYRFSKKDINSMFNPNSGNQPGQQPLNVLIGDYYLTGNKEADGKYCLISGIIDHEDGAIYQSKLLEIYDENKITEALNKSVDNN
jgi:hypothetical protein|tara:strand:+ start:845 stop:1291 length:447 start_codon:yes stop_codon:yes gene_type:complete